MNVKIIAFYLPQFHAIPENDVWWGKGFTDWVNVKKAKPLFKGHQQPREPLEDNYYDLSDPESIRRQADLARQYGVDGFCFYHYWFGGKLLLQKPAELLLQHRDIDLPFCFSWANEPWARTWDGKAHQILIDQSYGGSQDWEAHFAYLLPFFKDERYMKIDSAPVFLVYKSQSIPCAREMMDCWNRLAMQAGFNGIHFVETLRDNSTDSRDLPFRARVEFEPANILNGISTFRLYANRARRTTVSILNKLLHRQKPLSKVLQFSDIAKASLHTPQPEGTWGGVFAGWDNSPRRGLSATIISAPTKEQFKSYLQAKIDKTVNQYHTDHIFVNAWNEWAEGTVLEPDKLNGYHYLEAIKEVKDEHRNHNKRTDKRIAVFCVTYNSYRELHDYLKSIQTATSALTASTTVDVFVADNTDRQYQTINVPTEDTGYRLKVYPFHQNLGYFGAIREMMKREACATYDYVIISNVDVTMAPDCMERLVSASFGKDTGWVAPAIISNKTGVDMNPFTTRRYTARKLKTMRLFFRYPLLHRIHHYTFHQLKRRRTHQPGLVYAGHGSFIILTKEYIARCGTVNYPVFLYGEEIYLAEECRRHGLTVVYTPDIRVNDIGKVSTGKAPKSDYYHWNHEGLTYLIDTYYTE